MVPDATNSAVTPRSKARERSREQARRLVKWLNEIVPDANVVARNNSVLGLGYAVKLGVGIGPLPTAIPDGGSDLVQVLAPLPELARAAVF